MEKIKLAIIVSEPRFNRGLSLLINELSSLELQKKSFDADGLIQTNLSPDVIIMDTGNNFACDLREAATLIGSFPASKILLLSNFDDPRYQESVKSIGAHGLLKKPVNKNQLSRAIESLLQKEGFWHETAS